MTGVAVFCTENVNGTERLGFIGGFRVVGNVENRQFNSSESIAMYACLKNF